MHELPGGFDTAAWIQIDLELLQPIDLEDGVRGAPPRDTLERQRVWEEDYSGSAWFDDVTVMQLPRVELAASAPGGVFVAPGRPEFVGSVRDLTGERLRVRLTTTDVDGVVTARVERPLPGGQTQVRWSPEVASLGWGRVTLEVLNDTAVVGKAATAYVWLPAKEGGEAPGGRRTTGATTMTSVFMEPGKFALLAEETPIVALAAAPDIAAACGAGALTMSVWSPETTRSGARAMVAAMDDVVERAVAGNVVVTLAVGRMPAELASSLKIEQDDVLSVLGMVSLDPEPVWAPYLNDALSKFGQRVRRWQVGRTGDWSAFYRPDLSAELGRVERSLSRLVPRPTLVVPWAAEQKPDDRLSKGRALSVTMPPSVPVESLEAVARVFHDGREATMVIEPPAEETYGARAAVNALVKRAAFVWSADAPHMALDRPWTVENGGKTIAPRATLAAWRTLSERLGGRRVVGEMPVARGVRCLILDSISGGGRGALLAWNDLARGDDARIRMHLGEGPIIVVDPFGNATPALREGEEHVIPLGDTPVFIEGADIPLARFRAGFRVEPAFIPAEAALHAVDIELSNHWRTPITGVLRLTDPTNWKIEPRVIAFDIPAGKSQRFPLDLSFGIGEESGQKRLSAEADITADRAYRGVRMSATLEVGLDTTQLTASHAFITDAAGVPRDVSVTLQITNTGNEPQSLQAFALAPGYPREQAPVGALAPGQTAVRRFVFPGGAERLMGRRVRVGLVDVTGSGRLNKSLVIQ